MERAIFFDRDGTLTNTFVRDNKPYGPTDPSKLALLPGASQAVKKAKNLGFLTIVVSNQPDIALGKIDENTKTKIEEKFQELIKANDVPIDAIYYCNHHPKSINPNYPKVCECRKPKPGMILDAAKDWNIALNNSWVVGDTDKDINAGKAAGCKTILIKKPYSGVCQPDLVVGNLGEIIDIINRESTI